MDIQQILIACVLVVAGQSTAATAAPQGRPDVPVLQVDAATSRAIADRAAALLEERYVERQYGIRYAKALRRYALQGHYASISDPTALAKRMTADLQSIKQDGHLHFYRIDPPPSPSGSPPQTPEDSGASAPLPGIREIKWLEPGVAYLSFEHFDDRPVAMDAIGRFLVEYSGARALVIDSRANHGGAFDMLALLVNHLFAASRHLANMDMASAVVREYGSPFPVDGKTVIRAKGPPGMDRFEHWAVPARDNEAWFAVPVYYLISHETFSAAEHLAMVLKSNHRATLIGQTTGGGNHFGGTEPVGGDLELFVPVGRTTDPVTGRDWERLGIAPDLSVPSEEALDVALRLVHEARRMSSPD